MKNNMQLLKKYKALLTCCLLTVFLIYAKNIALPDPRFAMPLGFMAILTVVPLVIVLWLLFLHFDMVIAAFVGGILAMIISGIGLSEANTSMMSAIRELFGNTLLIVYGALAATLLQAGTYSAVAAYIYKFPSIKATHIGMGIVSLAALIAYLAGSASTSILLIAPLGWATLGAIPAFVATLSLATVVGSIMSASSFEIDQIIPASAINPDLSMGNVQPYLLLILMLVFLLAYVGIKRAKIIKVPENTTAFAEMSNAWLGKHAIPFLFIIFYLLLGANVNYLIGMEVFSPFVCMIVTLVLVYLCTPLSANESVTSLVHGASFILVRLFQVALFWGFMKIIAISGVFHIMAQGVLVVPSYVKLPTAIIIGALLALFLGMYPEGIMAIYMPFLAIIGLSSETLGFVIIGIALGSQISVADMSVQALSIAFREPSENIIRDNIFWVIIGCAIIIIMALMVRMMS